MMLWTELRIEMPTERLGFVISTTCIRRNMRPKRGRQDCSCSFYISRTKAIVKPVTFIRCG